jgi:hypothetical protein
MALPIPCRLLLGENHPDVATSYGNMTVYNKQGQHVMALEMIEKALQIQVSLLDGNLHYIRLQSVAEE